MKFSNEEIEKAKELKKFRLIEKTNLIPSVGSYLTGRTCPSDCIEVAANIFLITSDSAGSQSKQDLLWLPTFDEALEATKALKISFSQVTDFLHRKRFADGKERQGLYQLLIDHLR